MAIIQPQPTDKLNSPSHSKLHRVMCANDNAPDISICIDSDGGICFGNPTVDGTWRIVPSGTNLSLQVLELGVWVEKSITNSDGSVYHKFRKISVSDKLRANDYLVSALVQGISITLPTAVGCAGRMYTIDNASIGKITVDTSLSELISGELTQVLSPDDTMEVFSDGTNWRWK